LKIAYFIHWLDGIESGVFKKVISQIKLWQNESHDVKLFVFTQSESKLNFDLKKNKFTETEVINYKNNLFRFFNGYNVFSKIEDYNPDILYFRDTILDISLYKLLTKYVSIVELNSIEFNEINKHSIKYYLLKISNILKFKKINGVVSVSEEINKYYKKNFKKINNIVIANGIDLKNYNFYKSDIDNNNNNNKVEVVFIGTNNQKWHGVEKILYIAEKKSEWDFNIIGFQKSDFNSTIPSNVHLYGFLSKNEYVKIISKCNVAISTISLYKKNMNEASPLKSREYLAFGLPTIIGYYDTDLKNDFNFVCNIGNYENNIIDNLSKIEEFVYTWKNKKVDYKEIEFLDIKNKEIKRLEFFNKVLNG